MKLAIVSLHASPLGGVGSADGSGENVSVAGMARHLPSCDVQVVVHTRRRSERAPRRVVLNPGAVVDHVPAGPPVPLPKERLLPYVPGFGAELAAQWAVDPPDVVHAHSWMSGMAATVAARPLGIPVLLTYHGLAAVEGRYAGGFGSSPPSRLLIERALTRSVSGVVATSSEEVFALVRMGVPADRVSVIPGAADMTVFTPNGPADARPAASHRLLYVGRLAEHAGVETVIDALARVPDTQLVIAGGPSGVGLRGDPDAQRLRARAARAGVSDRVVFRGWVPQRDLPMLIRSADAVVCMPWYQPFGLAAVEAMACGVPVVAAATGGLMDTVVDGQTGVLVPPRDPEAAAAALVDLLTDESQRGRLGQSARVRARTHYSWPRVLAALVRRYSAARDGQEWSDDDDLVARAGSG